MDFLYQPIIKVEGGLRGEIEMYNMAIVLVFNETKMIPDV